MLGSRYILSPGALPTLLRRPLSSPVPIPASRLGSQTRNSTAGTAGTTARISHIWSAPPIPNGLCFPGRVRSRCAASLRCGQASTPPTLRSSPGLRMRPSAMLPRPTGSAVGRPYSLLNQYPVSLGVDWMDFGKTVQTRAVRLRLTAATNESRHGHLAGKTRNGNRVWLGELMAISPLDARSSAVVHSAPGRCCSATRRFPSISRLRRPAMCRWLSTMRRATGSEISSPTHGFLPGANTVWWDGLRRLGPRSRRRRHMASINIPTHFVAPGRYQVRGIYHQAIDLHYEFSMYSPGYPAWETLDSTGAWLTSHTPASSALFFPRIKRPAANRSSISAAGTRKAARDWPGWT